MIRVITLDFTYNLRFAGLVNFSNIVMSCLLGHGNTGHFWEFLTHQVAGDMGCIDSDVDCWMGHGYKTLNEYESMNSKAAQDNRSEAQVAARLSHIRIVLINTSHPGNIGASARAMKVMGLANLHLVNPKNFPCHEATAMASGADDLLQRSVVHDSLESALDGCSLVMGTIARLRSQQKPQMEFRSASQSV